MKILLYLQLQLGAPSQYCLVCFVVIFTLAFFLQAEDCSFTIYGLYHFKACGDLPEVYITLFVRKPLVKITQHGFFHSVWPHVADLKQLDSLVSDLCVLTPPC